MTSTVNQISFENLSLCVYIGNTTSFDDQTLINYCSQFGKIISCSIPNCPDEKRSFCDFRIIEFATKQQLKYFLDQSIHKIGSIILDVKFYENLLNNFEILNIDRKIFIGPILNLNDINIIVQFYKLIDPNLNYYLSQQIKQKFILIECSNRQYIRTIIQQKTIPKTFDNQIFTIHLPINPKELINKKFSIRNTRNQIFIKGLTEQITENILIDYFEKRASILSCYILSTDRQCAIIEFENEKFVQNFLNLSAIRLYGANLSLSKVPDTIENNDEIDQLLESHHSAIRPISPEITECGWTSPPRDIITDHCPVIHHPPECVSSKPMNMNSNYQSRIIETDIKPMKNLTNNILQFVESFQYDLEQLKDEYMKKFTRDRTLIEHEINRLINDERITFDKFQRKHRRYSIDNKRKYS